MNAMGYKVTFLCLRKKNVSIRKIPYCRDGRQYIEKCGDVFNCCLLWKETSFTGGVLQFCYTFNIAVDTIQVEVFSVVNPRSVVVGYDRFGGLCCLHL